ncbi:MAG: energy transducer TonB [Kiritimatiellaeota bacterium]|nr:energy transducer TonB [Kiritimatiellota bacterium]
MNRARPGERGIRLIALCLCGVVYFAALGLIFQTLEKWEDQSVSVASRVTLNFVQMALQAPAAPLPEPDVSVDASAKAEEADVALEQVEETPEPQSEPEPIPEPDALVAQVTQEATAPERMVLVESVQGWVQELIETEKYYPPSAERFGITGIFDLKIVVDKGGTILSAEVLEGGGHRILRQALEKMLAKIIGRNYGEPVGEAMEVEVGFEFE